MLREYRRDIGRYFKGETDTCPLIPQSYFDDDTVHALTALRERSLCDRSEELLLEIWATLGEKRIEKTWNASAITIYRNWLEYICAQKERARAVEENQGHCQCTPDSLGQRACLKQSDPLFTVLSFRQRRA